MDCMLLMNDEFVQACHVVSAVCHGIGIVATKRLNCEMCRKWPCQPPHTMHIELSLFTANGVFFSWLWKELPALVLNWHYLWDKQVIESKCSVQGVKNVKASGITAAGHLMQLLGQHTRDMDRNSRQELDERNNHYSSFSNCCTPWTVLSRFLGHWGGRI